MTTSLRTTKPILHYSILAFMYAIGAVTLLSHTVLHAMEGSGHEQTHTGSKSISCATPATQHAVITFTPSGISPATSIVDRCTEVTVRNMTDQKVIVALGGHSHHVSYPGFTESELEPGQSYRFRAAQGGTYPIHDHDDNRLAGTLTVKP